jgi:hypothetical protein
VERDETQSEKHCERMHLGLLDGGKENFSFIVLKLSLRGIQLNNL